MIRKVARKILPSGSRRRIAAGRAKNLVLHGTFGPLDRYKNWVKEYEPLTLAPVLEKQDIMISIVVPAYNTPDKYIRPLINSVLSQTYGKWQLCIADGSTDPAMASNIKELCAVDERIQYIKLKENLGISGNTNQALPYVNGDYLAFLDHDDILPRWSLNEVAAAITKNPKAEIFYSDEDRLTENGRTRMTPLFKPDWSPELFLSANYLAHLFVIKRSFFKKLEKLRPEYDGSQDYDLALRALDYNPQIIHIPKVLYHMRMAHGSTAKSIGEKNYADEAGRQALEDYLKRNKIKAEVLEVPDRPTNHRIKYRLKPETLVSIIIPFKDKADLLKACVQSIESKTLYNNYEIILISNNSSEVATKKYLNGIENNQKIKVYDYDKPFNYSAINNFGAQKAKGSVLVFLNNDTEVITPEWLEELAGVAQQPKVGAVGALLLYPDGTIQHAGIIVGMLGAAGIIFRGLKLGVLTPFWLPDWPRNFLAVTGACLAVEKSKFNSVNGFNEDFIVAGGDVTLGIDLYEKGYRNVFWPFARLTHHESKSVGGAGKYTSAPLSDYDNSMKHYKPYLNYKDPYFNPNLNIMNEKPSMRTNYDK